MSLKIGNMIHYFIILFCNQDNISFCRIISVVNNMAFVLNRTLGPIVSRRLLQRMITTAASEQQYRFRSSTPFNTVILFVPQQEAWVVERMGKFYKTLSPVS